MQSLLWSESPRLFASHFGVAAYDTCMNHHNAMDSAKQDPEGSVPLLRYATVLAIWCRWPDTPRWHAKAQELSLSRFIVYLLYVSA